MKYKCNWIYYFLFFIISCNEKSDNTTIINPTAPEAPEDTIYQMNLSSDSGTNLENITISWANADESMQIMDELGVVIDEISENLYNFTEMEPGEFQDIHLEITVADSTYRDDIQIFTRSVNPVTNFTCTTNEIVEYDSKYDEGERFYDYIPNTGNGIYDNYEYNGDSISKENFIEGNDTYNGTDDCICINDSIIPDHCAECYIDSINSKYDAENNETIIENGTYDSDDTCICNNNNTVPNGCTECYYDSINNEYDTGELFINCGTDNEGDSICENDPNWQDSFGNNVYDGDDTCICNNNNTVPNGCTECYYDSMNSEYNIGEDFKEDGPYNDGDTCICNNNTIPNECTECYIDTKNNKYDEDDNEAFLELNEVFDGDNNCTCNDDPIHPIPSGCTECYYDGNGIYDGPLDDSCICSNNELPNGCTECYIDGIPVYHRYLNWSATIEESFQQYSIYRAPADYQDELKDPSDCNSCEMVETLTSQSVNSYIDSTEEVLTFPNPDDFFYSIQVSTGTYNQNSFIQPSYLNFSEQMSLNASTDKNTYIEINWTAQTTNYFYQYEIQRARDIEGEIIEDTIIIPDATIDHYIDRNAGDGTTKFYRITVTYIDGTSSQPSAFVEGYSMP